MQLPVREQRKRPLLSLNSPSRTLPYGVLHGLQVGYKLRHSFHVHVGDFKMRGDIKVTRRNEGRIQNRLRHEKSLASCWGKRKSQQSELTGVTVRPWQSRPPQPSLAGHETE